VDACEYTVASADQTVQHYNGKELGSSTYVPSTYASRRDARYTPGPGRGQMTVRYPGDLSNTMKSCIDKIDEEHKIKGNKRTPEGGGWGNIFSCCGPSAEEFATETPAVESVVTDDESDASSAGSLDALLDDTNVSGSGDTMQSCPSDEAMLLESAKRDSRLHDTSRQNKRYRGHSRSSLDSSIIKKVVESPPLPSGRGSQGEGRRRRRSNSKLGKNDAGDENYPWSSPSPSGSNLRRSRSRSGSVSQSAHQFEDNLSAVVGRRSHSHTKSRKVTEAGQILPPLSPKISADEIAGLDMLVELQKQEALTDRKLERRGSFRREKRRPKSKASKFVRPNTDSNSEAISVSSNSDSNPETITPSIKAEVIIKYMYGPRSGTHENISTEEDVYGPEVVNTYCAYRLNLQFTKMVNQMNFTLPLYHSLSPTCSLKNACSEPIASGFHIRGPTYLEDAVKIPSRETLFSVLGANNVLRRKAESSGPSHGRLDFLNKLRSTCLESSVHVPFILVINFIVPWGNFSSYYYRPDGTNGGPFSESESEQPAEKLWRAFLTGNDEFRKNKLKLIPAIVVGPWVLKKTVGQKPGMIGQKLPVTYLGSYDDGYLEICLDITKGGKLANSICSACASKASIIAVDLAFLLQGDNREELPEQLLTVVRLHHVQLKKGNLTY